MNLSVVMIVKNEERLIQRALRSVREADEIVIVDTGSTDKTEEIVQSLNWPNITWLANAYAWNDDFAEARNFAMNQAQNDWCLFLDADDRMVEDAIFEIKEAILANPEANALNVKISHENVTGFHYVYPKVLRKSSGNRFVGRAHEAPALSSSNVVASEMILGRSENHGRDPERALRILQLMWQEDSKNSRTLYYLAREYYYLKEFAKAEAHFLACCELSRFNAERADAWLYLARIYWAQNEGDNARFACMQSITINANFREALCFMAELSFPTNAKQWRAYAKLANNDKVLFVRPCCN